MRPQPSHKWGRNASAQQAWQHRHEHIPCWRHARRRASHQHTSIRGIRDSGSPSSRWVPSRESSRYNYCVCTPGTRHCGVGYPPRETHPTQPSCHAHGHALRLSMRRSSTMQQAAAPDVGRLRQQLPGISEGSPRDLRGISEGSPRDLPGTALRQRRLPD